MTGPVRHALYFAPAPGSPLWRFGSAVLGYDAASGADVPFAVPHGCAGLDWTAITGEPRRYGFHATLKAPFRLADGMSEEMLIARLDAIARQEPAFPLDGLRVAALGSFIALVPAGATDVLEHFAFRVVKSFEAFRAPLSEPEMARRLKTPLGPEHRANLDRYGYPYVGAAFRFHMTLTGSLEPQAMERILPGLERAFAESIAPGPVPVDRIALFRQDSPDARFRIRHVAALAPAQAGAQSQAQSCA